jgi:hypothetical protein
MSLWVSTNQGTFNIAEQLLASEEGSCFTLSGQPLIIVKGSSLKCRLQLCPNIPEVTHQRRSLLAKPAVKQKKQPLLSPHQHQIVLLLEHHLDRGKN